MKVLNTPIRDLTFEDIVAFCEEKHIEGIQLDYKKDFSPKGLAKHIAALSNTRGGIIIIGVEEDSRTGLPLKWEGIENKGKPEDRAHQFASNVEPFPNYDVWTTDESNGKVFLLVRIFEGDQTPYYVHNDNNCWVRTGSISTPIDIASPEHLELLFGKREKAEQARSLFIHRADEVYQAALDRAEEERFTLFNVERSNYDQKQRYNRDLGITQDIPPLRTYKQQLGSEAAMCTVLLQPYFPHESFIGPLDLKVISQQLRVQSSFAAFPSMNVAQETFPEGILSFDWHRDYGNITCEQIYGNGLVFITDDVLIIRDNVKQLYLATVARQLFLTLLYSANYYKKICYQGNVLGYISFSDVQGLHVLPISLDGSHGIWWDEQKKCLLKNYKWNIKTNTLVLSDTTEIQQLFREMMNRIYVGLNFEPPTEKLYEAFIKHEGFKIGL